MINAYISGTGFYVPPRVVTNDDLTREYNMDTNDEWIVQRTGIKERRFAEAGVRTSDVALKASEDAIASAGIQKEDLDMILFATLSSDIQFPGSGVFLQQKLGLLEGDSPKFVPAMDIRNQCSGFLYGLGTAVSMIKSGAYKNILLVGAEIQSSALDLSTRGRTVASLFGDGAGAVIVSATQEDRGVRTWHLGADGRYAEVLCLRLWDMSKKPYIPVNEEGVGQVSPEILWPYMEGKVVFRHAVEKMIAALMQACWSQNIMPSDIDLFVFHQANKRINEYVANQLNLPPEKVLHNIDRYGNTTAATIPILLAEAERNGTLKRGMKVAMVAFGSGFTWGSAICDW